MELAKRIGGLWYWEVATVLAGVTLWTAFKLLAVTLTERNMLLSSLVGIRATEQRARVAGRDAVAVLQSLPGGGRPNAFLSSLLREAIKTNVELRDIAVMPPAESVERPLQQLKVSAKLVGTYSDVKQTVANAMRAEPSTALDSIAMNRMPQGQGVEALMQWSVYYRIAGGR